MRIAVPKETAPDERRVALVPDGVARLVKAGHTVTVERGAGAAAGFVDTGFEKVGAQLTTGFAATVAGAAAIAKVQRPSSEEAEQLPVGSVLVSLLQPSSQRALLERLAARGITAFAMELVPRTTKAQAMDALSSQATVAGYKAVLLGASQLGRLLPMMTTAAGTLAPAKAFIVGAGVAGLQAIATARRLGAIVTAFDVRPAAREQVLSLGARFVEAEAVSASAEGAGGYAKELAADQQRSVLDAVGRTVPQMDLVITTAQIPGKRAPLLVTRAMLDTMQPGAVVVDLAAETGGNCEATVAGETVSVNGVTVIGPVNLAASVPFHASQMYSRNVATFLEYLAPTPELTVNLDDPIIGPMCVTHAGALHGAAA